MHVKIEDQSNRDIKNLLLTIEKILQAVPSEHLRGFHRMVCVDHVTEPRVAAAQRESLPGLYHPRMGGQSAWGEVALEVIRPRKRFPRNIPVRMMFKPNLAQVVLSLVAQHYYLTLSKGVKKGQLELVCRQYVETHFEKWRDLEGGLRTRLFKPLRPYLNRLAKKLARRYREDKARGGKKQAKA